MSISTRVKDIIGRIACIEPSRIEDDMVLGDDLGFDTVDYTDLVVTLEDEFEVVLPEDAEDTLVDVESVLRLVEAAQTTEVA